MTNRAIPHNLDAEESLLGSMLLSRGATLAALDAGVTSVTFYKPAHGAVFDACVEVFASGAGVDPVTVAAAMNGQFALIGGRSALDRLQASTPASAHAEHYADLIVECERRRRTIGIAEEARDAAFEGDLDRALESLSEHARILTSGIGHGGRNVALRCASGIVPAPVSLLWDPWMVCGNVNLILGEPGQGKSTLSLYVIAALTRGTLPGDWFGKPARCLIWSGEDAADTTLIPRLRVGDADLDLVEIVTITEDGLEDGLTLPRDIDALEAAITDDVAYLMVDPFMAALDGSIDSHKDQSVRRAIAPLFRLAERTGVAVGLVAHTNKQTSGSFTQRAGGSVGITGAVRSAMLVGHDPEHPEIENARILVHAKHNLTPPASSQRFEVVGATIETDPPIKTSRIEWGESAPHLTAEDVLRSPATERPTPKLDAATDLLNTMLKNGARLRSEIETAAEDRDVSWRTVMTAKADLGISDRQIKETLGRGPGPSWWFFPDKPPVDPNGVQPPSEQLIADHSIGAETSTGAGSEGVDANGLQGVQCSREGIADQQHARDAAAAAEASE